MIPPPTPAYPYQRHTPEGVFPVSPPMTSPSSAPNPGQFHSSPYPPYSYSASPVYPSQAYYPRHYAPTDVEGQGTWWYLPHAAPNAPSYSGHYYPPVHQESDSNTAYPASPMGGPPLPPSYPVSPIHSPSSSLFRPSLGNSPADTPVSLDDTPVSPSPAPSPDKPSPTPPVRRPYHPNPPSHRSEWVMWAGNVPSDATHDELWRFFTQADDNDKPSGVVSIFLISRSSCAFINYETGADLQAAILKFNGVPLRSHDPRCPRLVCRVRKVDDDLKAGVGGQRGVGMHIKWVREKEKNRTKTTDPSDQSDLDDSSSSITGPSLSMSSDDSHHRPVAKGRHSGSSGSYASTNSSLLVRHFPKRYFILKSLSQYDLDLSVQKNLWATQKHNEDILDQAYRTSKEVYLIFGVNKSGEFYGYAKMTGPVRQGEQRVSWATRTDSSSSSRSSLSPVAGRLPLSEPIPEASPAPSTSNNFFPDREHRLVEDSPAPFSPGQSVSSGAAHLSSITKGVSAPAELGQEHHKITMDTPSAKHSLDDRFKQKALSQKALSQFHDPTPDNFTLDQSAPFEAMRDDRRGGEELSKFRLKSVQEVEERAEDPVKPETWGESFKVEWICTDRLAFYRTRHLRNPWNHDREVKVSRDGTELEPSVGEQLLGEWHKLIQEKQQQQIQTQTPSEQASGGIGSVAKPPKRSGASSRSAKETGPPSTSRS
jgi:hypothetical protein